MTLRQEFIGRANELTDLGRLLKRKTASLVAIKGRRRIGKSRLIEEFCREQNAFDFIGLPPDKHITAQSQRDNFAQQLQQQTGLPKIKTDDWADLFALLAEQVKEKQIIIIFDEITWMASNDNTFLAKLHSAWERFFRRNPKLILILCGSISHWIEENILSNTGYFGRITLKMTLKELSLPSCNQLLNYHQFKRSPIEKLIFLSVTGGVPWYLENINAELSAEENIRALCFKPDGLLVDEFEKIFHDLFKDARKDVCKRIIEFLTKKPASNTEIANAIGYSNSGALSNYLDELIEAGFVQKHTAWQVQTGKASNRARYRLSDNYLRFYLKCIQPRLTQIAKGRFQHMQLHELPGWNTLLGLLFENLVLKNRQFILEALNIQPESIVNDDPFYQNKTSKQQGCQIDYLIQTKFKTLFLCEITFSVNPVGTSVINEVQSKIERLNLPKGYACIPVLIHANTVTPPIENSEFFGKIINVSDWLEPCLG